MLNFNPVTWGNVHAKLEIIVITHTGDLQTDQKKIMRPITPSLLIEDSKSFVENSR